MDGYPTWMVAGAVVAVVILVGSALHSLFGKRK